MSKRRRTVNDLCNRIHADFASKFKYAMVWGRSVKHYPQRVGKDHVFMDQDVVQIVITKNINF
jgi:ribosome-interacting GTPase 1